MIPWIRWNQDQTFSKGVRDMEVACSRIANKTARILAYTYADALGRWFDARTTRTLRILRLEAYCFGGPAAREKSGYAEDSTFMSRTLSKANRPIFWCLVLGLLAFAIKPAPAQNQPSNVRLTAAAWTAFLNKDWKLAISKADDCIRRHRLTADRLQANLEQSRAPAPPTGPATPEEIKAIFARGPLNDVATCWLIKAWALVQLQLRADAEKAYAAAAKYTYARCWDPPPNGWFWSPAEEASYR